MAFAQHRREVEVHGGDGKRVWRGPIELTATGDPNDAPANEAFECAAIAKCREAGQLGAGDMKASAKVVKYLGGYNARRDGE